MSACWFPKLISPDKTSVYDAASFSVISFNKLCFATLFYVMKSKAPAQIYVNMHDFYNLSMYNYFLIYFHI